MPEVKAFNARWAGEMLLTLPRGACAHCPDAQMRKPHALGLCPDWGWMILGLLWATRN